MAPLHELKSVPGHDSVEIDYESLPENSSLVAQLSAGAFAGIMEHTVMYPIDAIKTRMQIAERTVLPKGIIASVTQISSTEGAKALWRGVSSVMLGAGPAHAIYFGVFESTKTSLVNFFTSSQNTKLVTDENHPLIASASGICATTASDALMTPFDVLKQRMQAHQTNTKENINVWQLAKKLKATEGISTFYVSYPTTLLMNIPFAALNFGMYEWSASILNPQHDYNPMLHCISGGISGAIAAGITTPLDCIKTTLQTRSLNHDPLIQKAKGFKDAAKIMWKTGGYSSFTKGLRPRVIFNVPSTAISWTAYEMAKAYLLHE